MAKTWLLNEKMEHWAISVVKHESRERAFKVNCSGICLAQYFNVLFLISRLFVLKS